VPATPIPNPTSAVVPDFTLTGKIIIDGSSTVFPITEAVSNAFALFAPGVQVQLGVSGTSGGFKKFCQGETDISDASRPITQSEIQLCKANGIDFVELPVAFDGISVIVHADNQWAGCMTVAELKQLWEPAAEGVIKKWNQIRIGWPDHPVALYGPGNDSGTYDYFTTAIVGQASKSRTDYTGSEDDYLLAQDIASNPDGLGFFGFAYYREYIGRLRIVAIDAGDGRGCITPSEETIANGSYQPLSRPLFVYVRADALTRPELQTFIHFYLDNAEQLVRQARSIPLSAGIYTLVSKRAEARRIGSVFKGGPQIGVSIEKLLRLEQQ
jgi:phosphate transport system substrate-binding protein